MDILVCSIEGQQIGLELNKINSVVLAVETAAIPNAPDYFLGAINVHGQIIPVLDMRRLLGKPIKELDVKDQFIICTIHQRLVAIWVDNVMHIRHYKREELNSVDKILPDNLGLQYIFKEDGQIIFVYDLEKLLPLQAMNLNY